MLEYAMAQFFLECFAWKGRKDFIFDKIEDRFFKRIRFNMSVLTSVRMFFAAQRRKMYRERVKQDLGL